MSLTKVTYSMIDSAPVSISDYAGDVTAAIADAVAKNTYVQILSDITVTVPTNAANMQIVFDRLKVFNGSRVTINIASGYKVPSGTSLFSGDFSMFTVVSEDATVLVESTFPSGNNLFTLSSCNGPIISCFFDMLDLGTDGFNIGRRSTLSLTDGAGVQNCGRTGAYILSGSILSGPGAILRYCKGRNVECTSASTADLQTADLRGGNRDAIYYGSVYARRASTISAQDANFSDTVGLALGADRSSKVNASGSTFTNTDECVFAGTGAIVTIADSVVTNCKNLLTSSYDGLVIADGVVATLAIPTSADSAVRCRFGGNASAYGATISGNNVGYFANVTGASKFKYNSSTASNFDRPFLIGFGSTVYCTSSDISTGFVNRSDISNGSMLWLNGTTTKNSSVSGTPNPIDTNVTLFNTIYSNGIVWG